MLVRILRLSLGLQEGAARSLSNLCRECGSMHTSSSFASPVLNSLVHYIFSIPESVWHMVDVQKPPLALEGSSKGKRQPSKWQIYPAQETGP